MKTGEALLRRLLAQNAQQLREAARLLAADYGFRAAIAVGDAATLTDALSNQAERIGADVAVFTDPRGTPVAATLADARPILSMLAADARADPSARGDTGLQAHDGRAYQMVTVPVKAPTLIGQVSMGYPLAATLPDDLRTLSSLGVFLLARAPGGAWQPLAIAGAPAPDGTAARRHRPRRRPTASAEIDGESTALHLVPLGRNGEREIAALADALDRRRRRAVPRAADRARRHHARRRARVRRRHLLHRTPDHAADQRARRERWPARLGRLREPRARRPAPTRSAISPARSSRCGSASASATPRSAGSPTGIRSPACRTASSSARSSRIGSSSPSAAATPCSVLMLDIDRFKQVNDVLGHAFGDRLLGAIATRLQGGVLREGDTLARLGGDKFVVCMPRATVESAMAVAERLCALLRMPITLDEHTVDVSAGVGIAAFPDHATTADLLLGRAELAMYSAKARQSGVTVYHPALDSSSEASLSLLERAAHGDRRGPAAPLPAAQVLARLGRGVRRRGARALAASAPRPARPGRIHPVRRAQRLHPRDHPLDGRAQRGAVRAAARPRPRPEDRRQPLDARPDGPAPGRQARADARARRPRAEGARPRDHRERDDGRPRARARDAAAPRCDGPHALGRRLRHRLLVARLPEAPAAASAEDRPQLRDGHGDRPRRPEDRPLDHRPRPQPRLQRRRRRASRRRRPGPSCVP